jgi:uncharacterized membrane protein HdeD (DUF308 family)
MTREDSPGRIGLRVVIAVRAFLALLLGVVGLFMVVLAVFLPGTTTVLVVQLFAGYALLDGVLSIAAAARAVRQRLPSGLMVLEGLLEIGTAVAAFVLISGARPRGILALMAAWAVATGVLQLAWIFRLDVRRGRTLLVAAAALSVIFGVLLIGWRPPDLFTAVWRLAIYALLLGILRAAAAFRVQGP